MKKIFLFIISTMFFLISYSQQYVLTMQGQPLETYNSKAECETARGKMDNFDKQKFVKSFNDAGAPIGAKISTNDVPDINFSKLCRCISLSEYKQIETGQKYTPFVYGELTDFFDKIDSKWLEANIPELAVFRTNFLKMEQYEVPTSVTINSTENIDSRNSELLADLEDENFDTEMSINSILAIIDNFMGSIDEDVPEEDLSALIAEIELLESIYSKLMEAKQIEENEIEEAIRQKDKETEHK